MAAQKLGIKELPCVRVDYLTAAQVKALRILDNKLNESEWDLDFLNEELPEIDLTGFDVDFDFALSADGFDEIVEDEPPAIDFATAPHFMRTSEEWRHGRSVKRLSKINSEVKGRENKWLKNGQECLTADRLLTGIRRKKKSGLRRSSRVFAAYNVQKKKYAAC